MERFKEVIRDFTITLFLIILLCLLSWGPLTWIYNGVFMPNQDVEVRQELDAIHAEINELKGR